MGLQINLSSPIGATFFLGLLMTKIPVRERYSMSPKKQKKKTVIEVYIEEMVRMTITDHILNTYIELAH